MLQKQKETILALLKSDGANKNYKCNYWFSYKDYLDPTDNFTDEFISADTLIIFSTLPLHEIKQIFNESKDIFPSDIGELTDSSLDYVVGDNGNLFPSVNLFNNGYSAYYCWWD